MLSHLFALASLLLPLSPIEAPPSLDVTPDGTATMVSDTNALAFATFKLINTGNSPANISLSCTSTGTASGCAVLGSTTSVAAGQHAFIVVSYHSGGEGPGTLSLTASAGNIIAHGMYVTNSQPGARRAPSWIGAQSTQGQATTMAGGGGGGGQSSTPFVSIWAPSFSSTANVFVSIMWCDNGNPLNASSRLIRLNMVNVTSNFDYNNIGMDCLVATAEAQGTITLSAGNNLLSASIANTWPKTGSDSHQILLAGPGAPALDISMNAEGLERGACVSAPAGPAGAFQCGYLVVAHSMPSFRTLDKDRTIALVYNSDAARSNPVIMADISLPNTVATPDSLRLEVIIGTNTWAFSFSSAGLIPGGPKRRVALPLNVQGAVSTNESHQYTVRSYSFYGAAAPDTASQIGRLFLLDRSTSPYGAGWSVAGVDKLFCFTSRCIIAGGDGSTKVYEEAGSNIWVATRGAYRDTLQYVETASPGGDTGFYYIRRDLDDTESFFNGAGNLKWVADRTGQKVEYTYVNDGDWMSPLSWIQIAPHEDTLRYNFSYSNGKLASITDPAGRVLAATVSSGKLTKLRDPGFLSGTGEVQFGYDSNGRMTSWTSKLGFVTKYSFYGNTQLLHSDTLPQTHAGKATTSFVPVQARGLHTGGFLAATSDSANVRMDGPRTDVSDIAVAWVNRFGAPDSLQDALGHRTRIKYDTAAPLLRIRIQSPNGRVVRMRYDTSARLVWSEDSTHSAGRDSVNYTYGNPAIRDKPTQVTTPLDANRRMTASFTYNSLGLLQQATDGRGHTTVYRYTSRAQVDSIAEQNVPVWVSTNQQRVMRDVDTRIRYDSLGNHYMVITEQGYQWKVWRDAYGNVVESRNPVGDSITYTYDVRNQQRSVTRYDTAGVYLTTIGYDTAGNVVRRTDPRGVNRYWEYDALGQDTATLDEFSKREIRRYNLAGQLVTTIARQGDSTSTKYDALGRTERTLLHPVIVNNSTEQALYGQPINTVLVPLDTLKYEYGVPGFGGPTLAENRQALIRRT
jgi:YD repeat-containing protein